MKDAINRVRARLTQIELAYEPNGKGAPVVPDRDLLESLTLGIFRDMAIISVFIIDPEKGL